MTVAIVEAVPDKVEAAAIEQAEEAVGGALCQSTLGGAFRLPELGGVDPDQPYPAPSEPERVTVDHASHAAGLPAARETGLDPFGARSNRADWRDDRGVEQRTNERKQRDQQRGFDNAPTLAPEPALTGAARSKRPHAANMAQAAAI